MKPRQLKTPSLNSFSLRPSVFRSGSSFSSTSFEAAPKPSGRCRSRFPRQALSRSSSRPYSRTSASGRRAKCGSSEDPALFRWSAASRAEGTGPAKAHRPAASVSAYHARHRACRDIGRHRATSLIVVFWPTNSDFPPARSPAVKGHYHLGAHRPVSRHDIHIVGPHAMLDDDPPVQRGRGEQSGLRQQFALHLFIADCLEI